MHRETVIGFYDEMVKISASLSAEQLRRVGDKALKRGWSGAREAKSIKRLMNRDVRPELHAARKAAKDYLPPTRITRPPPAAGTHSSPSAARSNPAPTPSVSSPKGRSFQVPVNIRKFAPKAAVGVGAAGAGAEGEHIHHKRQEERRRAS